MVYTIDVILTSITSPLPRQYIKNITKKRGLPPPYYAVNRYIKGYIYICDSK